MTGAELSARQQHSVIGAARRQAARMLAQSLSISACKGGSAAEQTPAPCMHQHGGEIPWRDAGFARENLRREQPPAGAFVLHHGLLLTLGDGHGEKAHAVEARRRKR